MSCCDIWGDKFALYAFFKQLNLLRFRTWLHESFQPRDWVSTHLAELKFHPTSPCIPLLIPIFDYMVKSQPWGWNHTRGSNFIPSWAGRTNPGVERLLAHAFIFGHEGKSKSDLIEKTQRGWISTSTYLQMLTPLRFCFWMFCFSSSASFRCREVDFLRFLAPRCHHQTNLTNQRHANYRSKM